MEPRKFGPAFSHLCRSSLFLPFSIDRTGLVFRPTEFGAGQAAMIGWVALDKVW